MLFYNDLFSKFRKSKCLTLEEIGKQIGVSKQTVQKWESGAVKPRPHNIYAVARILGVSAVDISDLKPEKWLLDSLSQSGNGNVAINGSNVGTFIHGAENVENFRAGLTSEIIMLDIDPVAKDLVLKTIQKYGKNEDRSNEK